MRPRRLTARISMVFGLFASAVIIAVSVLFTASFYYLTERDIKAYLVAETTQLVDEQFVLSGNEIRYKFSPTGESIAARLRKRGVSAVIFSRDLSVRNAFGIYTPLTDTGGTAPFYTDILLNRVRDSATGSFSHATLPTGEQYEIYTTPILNGKQFVGIIQMAREERSITNLLTVTGGTLLTVVPLTILASWILGYILVRRSLRPLTQLADHLDRTPHDEIPKPLPRQKVTDEIGTFVRTFNTVLMRVGESVRRQREFIANASHELRTPLTKAISTLDVALLKLQRDPMSVTAQIELAKSDLLHLNATLEDLLYLASIKEPGPSDKTDPTKPAELIGTILDRDPRISAKALHIRLKLDRQAVFNIPPEYGRLMIANIIDNAVKYTPPGGAVTISLDDRDGKTLLSVRDSGQGMTDEEKAHMFTRHFHGKRRRDSHGIGLSIVKQIAELYGVTIRVDSHPGQGTAVILSQQT